VRSPSSPSLDVTVKPIFLPTVPDKKPRTECGCQPVAFINSLAVTPLGRFSRSRTLAVLLPSRGWVAFFSPSGALFGLLAFFPDLSFFSATWAPRGATRVFCWRSTAPCSLALAPPQFLRSIQYFDFSFGGDYRHDIHHSGCSGKQADSDVNRDRRWNGDGHGWRAPLAAFGI
jgi:hypothetical protein